MGWTCGGVFQSLRMVYVGTREWPMNSSSGSAGTSNFSRSCNGNCKAGFESIGVSENYQRSDCEKDKLPA